MGVYVGVHFGGGSGGVVEKFAPAGGSRLSLMSVPHGLNDVEIGFGGEVVSVGDVQSPTTPLNFDCNGTAGFVGPGAIFNFPSGVAVERIPGGSYAFGWNGFGTGLKLVSVSGCAITGQSTVTNSPTGFGFWDVARHDALKLYGCPCVDGTGAMPQIVETSPPQQGTTWRVDLNSALIAQNAVLFVGSNNTSFGPSPLPLGLGGGAGLLSSGDVFTFQTTTNGSGFAQLPLFIPVDPMTVGLKLFCQWIVSDPGALNPFGVSLTSGLDTTIF